MGDSEQYTQRNRLLSIDTPLGTDTLLLQGLAGHEGVSRLFSYELELLAFNNDSISFQSIVGQNVNITIQLPDGTPRYINGYVSRFSQTGTDEQYFTHYHAQVVPWLWFLTRSADCRIFQNMTAPDIISQVFGLFTFAKYRQKLKSTYPKLEYCVQYRETAFNFISRLMEQFGIFYYFDHSVQGQHTLVMTDSTGGLQQCPTSPASYETAVGGLDDPETITDWHVEEELQTGKYSVTDYNFTTPSSSLLANESTVVSVTPNQGLETFDYPGPHPTKDIGVAVARLRMQEEETRCLVSSGSSNCRGFISGFTFQLQNHYRADQNIAYLLTEVWHVSSAGATYGTYNHETESYSNRFTCIPSTVDYRPARVTRKPFVQGPQPALVVGKSGEEIWTDNYGRVKVQFYWDRLGKQDENSSCWIRVSHPWAGQGWGAIALPRIGQEVIVDFLEGDPDRPIIMGRVYNAVQTVPYTLPDFQTRSTVQSRSSKGGGTQNYNEIRFEDKMGSEQIFVNAERDCDFRVENDSREYIRNNRHLIVNASQFELVGTDKHGHVSGKHFEKIDGDTSIHVQSNRMENVQQSESLEVGGDRAEAIGGSDSLAVAGSRMVAVGGNDSRTVSRDLKEKILGSVSLTVIGEQKESITSDVSRVVGGSIKEQVGSGFSQVVGASSNVQTGASYNLTAGASINLAGGLSINIQAGEGICLTGPGGFVSIGPAGVIIQGTMVLINSGGAASPATGASPDSPSSPDPPDGPAQPKNPTDPTDPDTADDGSKGTKLN